MYMLCLLTVAFSITQTQTNGNLLKEFNKQIELKSKAAIKPPSESDQVNFGSSKILLDYLDLLKNGNVVSNNIQIPTQQSGLSSIKSSNDKVKADSIESTRIQSTELLKRRLLNQIINTYRGSIIAQFHEQPVQKDHRQLGVKQPIVATTRTSVAPRDTTTVSINGASTLPDFLLGKDEQLKTTRKTSSPVTSPNPSMSSTTSLQASSLPTTKSTLTLPTTKSTLPATKSSISSIESSLPATKSALPATEEISTAQISPKATPIVSATTRNITQTTESTVFTTDILLPPIVRSPLPNVSVPTKEHAKPTAIVSILIPPVNTTSDYSVTKTTVYTANATVLPPSLSLIQKANESTTTPVTSDFNKANNKSAEPKQNSSSHTTESISTKLQHTSIPPLTVSPISSSSPEVIRVTEGNSVSDLPVALALTGETTAPNNASAQALLNQLKNTKFWSNLQHKKPDTTTPKGSTCDDKCAIIENVCQNGATCISSCSGFTCACASGFTGYVCDKKIESETTISPTAKP